MISANVRSSASLCGRRERRYPGVARCTSRERARAPAAAAPRRRAAARRDGWRAASVTIASVASPNRRSAMRSVGVQRGEIGGVAEVGQQQEARARGPGRARAAHGGRPSASSPATCTNGRQSSRSGGASIAISVRGAPVANGDAEVAAEARVRRRRCEREALVGKAIRDPALEAALRGGPSGV